MRDIQIGEDAVLNAIKAHKKRISVRNWHLTMKERGYVINDGAKNVLMIFYKKKGNK